MEDSFSGYLLNELSFCSSNNSNDFSYDSCPAACVTQNAPFWNAASIDFAKKASGLARAVLNGTRSFGAVSNRSTFLLKEVPNLDSSKVKQLTVYLLHDPNQPKFETCSNPKTLTVLQNILASKNIAYACTDNPDDILLLLCFYNPASSTCQAIQNLINSGGLVSVGNIFAGNAFHISIFNCLLFFCLS